MGGDKEFKEFENLPEGWKRVTLGELVEETFSGDWGENPTESKDIFPVFSTLAIDYDGKIDFTKTVPRKLNKEKIEKLKLKKGMILIEKSGGSTDIPAGKVAILKQDFNGTCSNFVQILRVKERVCNSTYIFYRLLYNFKNSLTEKYQQKTTGIINFILRDYFKAYITLPPLPEQQKIAEILETIDNAIEKTDKIIEKYKRIKQGLMQDLLTKGIDENRNIRSEKTHKFKDSPLGMIPEEWEVVRLGEVAQIRNEKIVPPKDNKYIGLENIEKETANLNGFIPTDEIGGISNVFKAGDILFGKLRPNLKKFWYAKSDGYCSTELLVIFPLNPKIISEFLYLIIKSEGFLKIAESKVFGTKMPRTSWEILGNYSFPFPPLPEQQRIASILSQIDQTIEKEQQYKEKLERIRQGLMQDLLTGKVRVNHLLEESEDYVSQA